MAYFLPKTKVNLPEDIISIILSYVREKHPIVDKCIDDVIDKYNRCIFLNRKDYNYYNCHKIRMYSFEEELFKQIKRYHLLDVKTNGGYIYKISKDGVWSKYFKTHGDGVCYLTKLKHNHIEIENRVEIRI